MFTKKNIPLQKTAIHLLLLLTFLFLASSIGYVFQRLAFPEATIVLVYLLAVVLSSWLIEGFLFGIASSILATLAFNFFFTKPYFALAVNEASYIITLFIMILTALITSSLTTRALQNALSAKEREAESRAVYELIKQLTIAREMPEIASISVHVLSTYFRCSVGILYCDDDNKLENFFLQENPNGEIVHRRVSQLEKLQNQLLHSQGKVILGEEFHDWAIVGRENLFGVLRLPNEKANKLSSAQMNLLLSMIETISLAMESFYATESRLKERERVTQERFRSNLLRSISHDIRTPLSSVLGSTEMLLDMTKSEDERELLQNIHKDANWLHSLVENILNLTRIQEGKLLVNKELEAVEEVVGSAINRMDKLLLPYKLSVNIPLELLLVPMDAKLIEQALINLLDNAITHTPAGNEILVTVKKDRKKRNVCFIISDTGRGISENELPHIFEMFHTAQNKGGIGLGLAICQSIVNAHGGEIFARNRENHTGAEIIFTLPMEEKNYA
ncbi:sensor histidine kinase [Pilibacter termitis]|uniref:sensor histidine kinase n=1 Tax=Pilibacter termitis TaxID=263852 RepID=UPI00135660DD|nr:ATP-binding protein [Pilibacter termitis]